MVVHPRAVPGSRGYWVTQAGLGSTSSPELKSPSACTWGQRSTGRGADDRVLDGGTSGAACGGGCGGGTICGHPASLLGWQHTCMNSAMSSDPLHVGPGGSLPLGGCCPWYCRAKGYGRRRGPVRGRGCSQQPETRWETSNLLKGTLET